MCPACRFCLCSILFLCSGWYHFKPKFSLQQHVEIQPYLILPLFHPFSLSVCAVRHPISIQSHLAFISKWWRGTMVALFSVPLFFSPSFFFYIKARRASSDRQHCTFDCTVLQETDFFFFLWLIKEGFWRKVCFCSFRIMYLGLETLVIKMWCMLLFFKNFWNLIHLVSYLYTANVLTIKTKGTGNWRVPAGKICTIYGKGL